METVEKVREARGREALVCVVDVGDEWHSAGSHFTLLFREIFLLEVY